MEFFCRGKNNKKAKLRNREDNSHLARLLTLDKKKNSQNIKTTKS